MTLIPREHFLDPERFFDDFWSPSVRGPQPFGEFFAPRVDVTEQDGEYRISAELPGVRKDDIHLTLDQGVLTLSAEKSHEKKQEEEGRILRQERRFGKMSRSFNVGTAVGEADISASFANGVLTVTLPKPAAAPTRKSRIDINETDAA